MSKHLATYRYLILKRRSSISPIFRALKAQADAVGKMREPRLVGLLCAAQKALSMISGADFLKPLVVTTLKFRVFFPPKKPSFRKEII